MNCYGCKWLDEIKHFAKGDGYCAKVVQSINYKTGDRARYSNMERRELYEQGDFKKRFEEEN